jgi:hypothetical protein
MAGKGVESTAHIITGNHQHQHQRQNYVPYIGDVVLAVNNLDCGIWSELNTYSPGMMIIRNDTDLKSLEKEFLVRNPAFLQVLAWRRHTSHLDTGLLGLSPALEHATSTHV